MRYKDYLERPGWKRRRAWHLAWAKGRCALCGELGASEVHHIHYLTKGRERHADLLAVHRACHEELHQWFKPLRKGWNTDGKVYGRGPENPVAGQGARLTEAELQEVAW